MDTKGPINPPYQNKIYIHNFVNSFNHFVVLVPIKCNNVKTPDKTLLQDWIINFGPPLYLVTNRGSDNINIDMTQLCTLMGIRHLVCLMGIRTQYSPWTYGLVDVQNKIFGTFIRIVFQTTPPHQLHKHTKFICMLMHIIQNALQRLFFHLLNINCLYTTLYSSNI